MTRYDIPSSAFLEKNMLASASRWVWLYEVEVPTTPAPTRYRFVRDTSPTVFREHTYSPFPIGHGVMRDDAEGNLPTVSVTVSNVTRELMSVMNEHSGLVGQFAKLILTHELAIPSGGAVWESDYRIVSTSATAETISLTLGDYNLYQAKIPAQRLMRFYCRHAYQSGACGYAVDAGNFHYKATCDKTLFGANGCVAHGNSEALGGAPVVHPTRFGGFPGIPEPTTSGGI